MRTKIDHTASLIILPGLAFLIPIGSKLLPALILLYGLNWLLFHDYKEKLLNIKKNYKGFLFLTALYFLYAISLIYTSDTKAGFFDLEVKLSLLVLPLIFFTTRTRNNKELQNIFYAFVAGCFINISISFFHSLYLFAHSGLVTDFVYTQFTRQFHPSYFALYLNFSIVLLFYFLFEKKRKFKLELYLYIILIIAFSVGIILANSKAVIVTLIITLISGSFYYGYKKGFLAKTVLASIGFIVVASFIVVRTPALYNRIKDSRRISENFFKHEKLKDYEGTAQRILVWESSLNIIKDNLFIGVGTGDARAELLKEYEKKHYKYIIAKRLNSHNQFLQTAIATGIIGFLVLLSMFILPFVWSFRKGNFVFALFLGVVFINFLAESMIERQAGVIFFAFFNTLLYMQLNTDKSN